MAIATDAVWKETKEAFAEMADPETVRATIVSSMAMYMLLWVLPEPVSKGLAATLTAWLIAYLGVDTVWGLMGGWIQLVEEVDRATTFEQLREAGERYGKVMGRHAARAFVLLATAAIGNTAGLGPKGPGLPGYSRAAVLAETQGGFRLAAVGEVRSVAVSAEGVFTIALAPGAVAMTAQGGGDEKSLRPEALYRPLDFGFATTERERSMATQRSNAMSIVFLIQSSNPLSLPIHDASDESLSDAIQTVFPMNTEWAFMIWNGVYIPLSYKYDISLLTDDIVWLLEEMASKQRGARTVHWPSNTFSAVWHAVWDDEVIKVDAQWNCVLGGVRSLLAPSISIEKQAFMSEWKSLLMVVEKALGIAGYTESQLPALAHLRRVVGMLASNGAIYR